MTQQDVKKRLEGAGYKLVTNVKPAKGGGYTARANHDRIKVKHSSDKSSEGLDVKEDTTVLPGDVIEVAERFF